MLLNAFLTLAALFGASPTTAPAVQDSARVNGVVNFANCVTQSKHGKKEQANFEHIRKQMTSLMETTEKDLHEVSAKLEDTEYLDSLSPKSEEELKGKFQALQEDLGRYQNQFYQVLNHANCQMIQKMSTNISKAAERIAVQKSLDYVINKEVCFYIRADFDVTPQVIAEMDKTFELDVKAKNLSDNNGELNAIEDSIDQAG